MPANEPAPGATDRVAARDVAGRETEVADLRRALDGDTPVAVVGEAGIGKTTLVREAVRLSERRLFEGGGFATLDWLPYLALERATGLRLNGDLAWVGAACERVVGPDVLFVDDLQWAAAPSHDVVRGLASRVAVVVAVRSGAAGSDGLVQELSSAGFRLIRLGPLALGAAVSVALGRRPGLPPERARRLAELAGGNPFLIEELAIGGEDSPSLRLALRARLAALAPGERAGLALLALADRPLPRASVQGGLALVEAGFAIGADGNLAVRHGLLAEAMLAALSADERRTAHARLAKLVTEPGERARHLEATGERHRAHVLALEAVQAASTPGERAAHLRLAAATADGADADGFRIDAAASLRVSGDLEGATQVLDGVEASDPETRARAEAVRARIAWSRGAPDAMRSAIERGLALVGGRGSVAEALLRAEAVTVTALVDGHFDVGLRDASAAIDLARNAGADATRGLLLRATILAGLGRDGWAEALDAVVAAARAADDHETELSAANNLVTGHEMHGQPAVGRELAGAMLIRARALHLATWERQFGAMIASLDLHAGALDAALRRSEALLEESLDPLAEQQVGLVAALARIDMGRPDEAMPLLDRLLAVAPPDVTGRGDVLYIRAEAAFWGGQPAEALAALDDYRAFAESEYPTSFLVDVAVGWAALETGRPLPGRIARGEGRGMLAGAEIERGALETLARDEPASAATAFGLAATAYRGFHRRGELRAGWAAGEAARLAGDRARAQALLEAVEAPAVTAGFVGIAGRVRRSLRLLGLRRAVRTPNADRGSRLTPRERELSSLVGRGLTNAEIARRMGLGRPTVARILSNAMLKVQADTRSQLAARLVETP